MDLGVSRTARSGTFVKIIFEKGEPRYLYQDVYTFLAGQESAAQKET